MSANSSRIAWAAASISARADSIMAQPPRHRLQFGHGPTAPAPSVKIRSPDACGGHRQHPPTGHHVCQTVNGAAPTTSQGH
jgi:hypothetical protein